MKCELPLIFVFLIIATIHQGCKKDDEDISKYLPVITTLDVVDITYNSALSGGEILSDGGYPIIERGVCWGYEPEPTIHNLRTSDGVGMGDFISRAVGLSQESAYHLRAYATNSKGTGYGQVIDFSTESSPCGYSAVLTDARDGNSYLVIPIGNQCWMVNNLGYLPKVSPASQGSFLKAHYYVYSYQGIDIQQAKNINHYQNYGVLYNWPAAISACPEGWRLPNDNDWREMTDFLGGELIAGRKLKSPRVVPDPHPRWTTPFIDATNETGFTGLPGGYRDKSGTFYFLGLFAVWWSATEGQQTAAHNRYMLNYGKEIYPNYLNKAYGFSVRCLKDDDLSQ